MKTKNILRTLLIAVTMLLGANNMRAGESDPIYTATSFSGQINAGGQSVFTDASGSIRVYATPEPWNLQLKGSWGDALNLKNGDSEGFINKSGFVKTSRLSSGKESGYIDAELTQDAVNIIKSQGLVIWITKMVVTKVTFISNGVESSPVFTGSESGQASVGGQDVFTDPNGKIRIYAETPEWKLQFKGSWGAALSLKNGDKDGYITKSSYNNEGGYIDAQLTQDAVDIIKQQGLVLWVTNLIVTKITFVTGGGSTPGGGQGGEETITHTVRFWLNEAKASSDLWDIQTVAEGAALPNPSSNPTSEQKPGYIFKGWNWNGLQYMPDHDIDVVAIWEEEVTNYNVYTSYDQNYGTVELSDSYPEKGSTVYVTTTPAAGFYVSSIYLSTGDQISGSNNSYSFTMPEQSVTVYVEFAAGAVTAPITSSSMLATFSSDYDLDFSRVTGLKAYIVTGENEGYAVLRKVTGKVAAGTGLIIYGETTDIPVTINGSTPQGNLLVGVLSGTSVSGAGKYVLTEKSGAAVFAETSGTGATVAAGHAYLDLGGASARTRQIIIKVGDDSTGISDIEAESGEQVIYNLRGQRVEKPTRGGIYIINGKKVLVK